jgi:hypothetical protein
MNDERVKILGAAINQSTGTLAHTVLYAHYRAFESNESTFLAIIHLFCCFFLPMTMMTMNDEEPLIRSSGWMLDAHHVNKETK